jgi:major membrane immunogen (membrane-anchored lipoprotein)
MSRRMIYGLVSLVLLAACTTKAKYESMVEKGIASGERYDSLYLGISLGMTDSAFFAQCWKLNKEQKIYQGSGNLSVTYKMNELDEVAWKDFYPEFVDGKIVEMPMVFHYDAWAPWSRHLFSDSLQVEVLNLFKDWYGEDFLEVKNAEHGSAYVRVDGNRQITIFKLDDSRVKVIFKDLLAPDEDVL